jgi:pilus assembly protein Flp/PilA
MVAAVKRFWNDESGATAVEYGLMVALIAVVIIAAVTALGRTRRDTFQDVADEVSRELIATGMAGAKIGPGIPSPVPRNPQRSKSRERRMTTLLSRLWQDNSGATAVEYALMAGLIAVVIVLAVAALGDSVSAVFEDPELNDALVGS